MGREVFEMTDRIEGKVARILNARTLVINKGSTAGIIVGMQFAILNSRGADIKDPDTGEIIGSVELPKVIVKVVQVHENMAVASTFREFRTGLAFLADLQGGIRVETLRTNEKRLDQEEMSESESYVRAGDVAVQVLGDEFAGWAANR
jgi:hypothetical protein